MFTHISIYKFKIGKCLNVIKYTPANKVKNT